jgi:class 3 adenylate cyclase
MDPARAATWTNVERQYYAIMAVPFLLDAAIALVITIVADIPGLHERNLATGLVLLLAGLHIAARRLYAPIGANLRHGGGMALMERALTQLPLRSAIAAGALYLVAVALRLLPPLLFDGMALFENVPPEQRLSALDAAMTILVSGGFMFVVVYFLASDYLERLCALVFARTGENLGLFFGRFGLKLGYALVFAALAPLALVAADLASYTGERLVGEIYIDLSASLFGLLALLFWATRTLGRPLQRLDSGMRAAAAGDLGVRLPVTSNEEIGALTGRFNRMLEGLRERERLRETFGKFVDESVAAQLMGGLADGRIEGRTSEATLMFTDIQGFTALSERLAPADVIRLLNAYLPLVVAPIRRRGGVVNSFTGDGLFASFNLPLALPDHAVQAVAAAREIQQALADFRAPDGEILATRIGINTGSVVGGTIGTDDRLSYTLLGDAVNAAARLQELNKTYGTRILLSAATRESAGEANFAFRAVGDAALRGRKESVRVFTLAD